MRHVHRAQSPPPTRAHRNCFQGRIIQGPVCCTLAAILQGNSLDGFLQPTVGHRHDRSERPKGGATTSLCPFRYLVAEWMTRSAPSSSGRVSTGGHRAVDREQDPAGVGDARRLRDVGGHPVRVRSSGRRSAVRQASSAQRGLEVAPGPARVPVYPRCAVSAHQPSASLVSSDPPGFSASRWADASRCPAPRVADSGLPAARRPDASRDPATRRRNDGPGRGPRA